MNRRRQCFDFLTVTLHFVLNIVSRHSTPS